MQLAEEVSVGVEEESGVEETEIRPSEVDDKRDFSIRNTQTT